MTLDLKHLFLELQVVLGTTSAQVSLQLCMSLTKSIEKAYLAFHTQHLERKQEEADRQYGQNDNSGL